MRTLPFAALAAALALPLAAAPVPKEKSTAEKLVGTWKLVKSDVEHPEGFKAFTLEFAADGKLTARFTYEDDPDEVQEGKWKAAGDKIEYTLGDRSETVTIRTLTDDKLGVSDPEMKKEDFERVKEKKEPEKKEPEKKSE